MSHLTPSRHLFVCIHQQTHLHTMTKGTLEIGEFHPAATNAFRYIKSLGFRELMMWQESFSSSAIEGDRLAEICGETLERILNGQPVSDRYVLGLAWVMRPIEKDEE